MTHETISGQATVLPSRAPFIGRTKELQELRALVENAIREGEPGHALVLGPAGTGKSRLVHEFAQGIAEKSPDVRVFRGASAPSGTGLSAIQRILRARFGIVEGTETGQAQETLRQMMTDVFGDKRIGEFLHFIGAYLGLKFPESPFAKAVDEENAEYAVVSRAVLRRFFEVDAERHPIILVFEDLHAASDDTLDLVEYLMSALRGAPVVIVVVARPELVAQRPGLVSHAKVRIDLGALGEKEATDLLRNLMKPVADLPEEMIDTGVGMAGGSPYLLEQMVRAFVDCGAVRLENDRWTIDRSKLGHARLPLSVEDAIRARVAALTATERSLLEMAATLGGVFWLGALVAMGRMERSTPELWAGGEDVGAHYRDLLKGLEERDYVLRMPTSSMHPEPEWAFKHNLEREMLGKNAPRALVRRYHLIVAEWLEFRLAERTEEQCELLAHHFDAGGAQRKAAHYYLMAGDLARARYSNTRAAEYYALGLGLLGEEDVVLRVEALHHYGDVLQLAGQNEEALLTFRKMLDLAYKLDLRSKGGAAHNRIGRLYRAIGHLEDAMRHLGAGHALFEAANDLRGIGSSLDDVGKVHWMRGNYPAAERFMKNALELRTQMGDLRSIALSWNNLGLVYQDSGHFPEALEAFGEALRMRRQIGDHAGIAQTLNNLGTIHQDSGDHERAAQTYAEALSFAEAVGDRMRQAVILTNLGESHYRTDKPREAIDVLERAEDISSTLGDWILEGEILRGLGKAHLLTGDRERAKSYVDRAIALFEKARGKPFLGVALRTQAEIAAAEQDIGKRRAATISFQRALDLFDELGNEIEVARTATAFADFLDKDAASGRTLDGTPLPEDLRARARAIHERVRKVDPKLGPLASENTEVGAKPSY